MSGIARLARGVRRPEEAVWAPRAPVPTMHLGTINAVDLGRNTVAFRSNDPSGLILPGVRFLQAYSPSDPPQEGDLVRALHFGTAVVILGRQVVPDSAVILG